MTADGELVLRGWCGGRHPGHCGPQRCRGRSLHPPDLVLGPFTLDAGAKVEVELLVSDANPADNVVWLELPPESAACPSHCSCSGFDPIWIGVPDPASFDVVDSLDAFQPGYDFTVWPRSPWNTVLPEGRHLVLGGVPGGLGIRQVNEQTAPAVVMATEGLHPVMRGVGVGRLEILNAPTWKAPGG